MKTLKKLLTLITILGAIWIFASFLEVNMQNTNKNPHYSEWNCFYLMVR